MGGEQITIENFSNVKIQVLVVDDDSTSLAIAAATLKTSRYEVVTVKSPLDALSTLRSWKGFDLVLTDLHMPEMNGLQLQKTVEQEFKLPVVVMSADDNQGSILRCLEEGAVYYIVKPVQPNDLKNIWQYIVEVKKDNPSAGFGKPQGEQFYRNAITAGDAPCEPSLVGNQNQGQRDTEISSKKVDRSEQENGCAGQKCENSKSRKPKFVWTASLQKRFLQAIKHIGLDEAVPKNILEYMNVPGLTRENIASHLQKYRLFLRRVAGNVINSGNVPERTLKSSFASGLPETVLRFLRTRPHRLTSMNDVARTSGRYGSLGHFPSLRNPSFNQTRTAFSSFLSSSSSNIPRNSSLLSSGLIFPQSVIDNRSYQSNSNTISLGEPRDYEIGNFYGTNVSYGQNNVIHDGTNSGTALGSICQQIQSRNDISVNDPAEFASFNYSRHPQETSNNNLAQISDYVNGNYARTSLSAGGQGCIMKSNMQFSANNNNAVVVNNQASSHSIAQGTSAISAQTVTQSPFMHFNGQDTTDMLQSMPQYQNNAPGYLGDEDVKANALDNILSEQVGQVDLSGITSMVYEENSYQDVYQEQSEGKLLGGEFQSSEPIMHMEAFNFSESNLTPNQQNWINEFVNSLSDPSA